MGPDAIIRRFQLEPHPEGGWYRRTWTGPSDDGQARAHASAILYLLDDGQRSAPHRIDADELWIHSAGAALTLTTIDLNGHRVQRRLGSDLSAGDEPQGLVRQGTWQTARADEGWALVTCVVAPEFSFDGFEMGDPPADM